MPEGRRLLVEEALSAGLFQRSDDGVVVRSLAAVEYVGLAIEAGMPPPVAFDMVRAIGHVAADIACAAVDQFIAHVWPRRDDIDLARVLSRARLLLTQASASMVVHELGVALSRNEGGGEGDEELRALVDQIAIGRIRRLASFDEAEVQLPHTA